ncbi:MAG: hypothetical protein RBG13Loki_2073 [Promethearchaeota archaeon CR_4]|nr:MAG: hypothetical protein RBG13Loki_2073 [Candidatus Lokiarchaeota archaeon CR_4]
MKWIFSPREKNPRIFTLISASIVFLLIGLFGAGFPTKKVSSTDTQTSTQINPQFQELRIAASAPPIFIDGSNPSKDWDDCIWVNGSGTYGNPYVIQDLIIDGGGSGSCIYITNTWLYFRIENCTVTNSGTNLYDAGIRVSNSANGTIRSNTCVQNDGDGIYIDSTTNTTLSENNCLWNFIGIYLLFANNITLQGNNCTGNTSGFYFLYSNDNTLQGNNCTGNSVGIDIFFSSKNNVVGGNNCTENTNGICIREAQNNTLNGNNCKGNTNGILLISAPNNTLNRNNCTTNSHYGIQLEGSNYTQIFLNSAKNNGIDPFVETNCVGNNIHHNWFWLIPQASFSTSDPTCWAETWVGFTDNTIGDAPFSYQWNFGDGMGNATVQNPSHYFVLPGNYTITLTVTDFDDDAAVHSLNVSIQVNHHPTAHFTTKLLS